MSAVRAYQQAGIQGLLLSLISEGQTEASLRQALNARTLRRIEDIYRVGNQGFHPLIEPVAVYVHVESLIIAG